MSQPPNLAILSPRSWSWAELVTLLVGLAGCLLLLGYFVNRTREAAARSS